jgi:predicted nucleic acid-binding protein
LVDEKLLSNLSKMYGLRVWSTWTLLLEGLSRNYVGLDDIERAVDELGKKRFRLSVKQAQEIQDAARFIEKHKNKQ